MMYRLFTVLLWPNTYMENLAFTSVQFELGEVAQW